MGYCYFLGGDKRYKSQTWQEGGIKNGLKQAADQGHGLAQHVFGHAALRGEGMEYNPKLGLEYLEKSVKNGWKLALWMIGYCYINGTGVSADPKKGLIMVEALADKGFVGPQRDCGITYEKKQQYTEALKYYRLAADQGDCRALSRIGFYYQEGRGVSKSATTAMEYYQKAADLGYQPAKNSLKKLKESQSGCVVS